MTQTEAKTFNHQAIAAYVALSKLRAEIGNIYVTTDFLEVGEYESLVDVADKACTRAVDAMSWDEYQSAKEMLAIIHKNA